MPRGRKSLAPAEQAGPEFVGATPTKMAEQEATIRQMQENYADDRDLANQMLGQVQMANSIAKFADVVSLSKLKFIKESKAYRALSGKKGVAPDGAEIADVGTFDGFCQALGMSRAKVDEDLKNLEVFGEEALRNLSAVGAGYRELRQYRRLPEDSQTALIEVAKSGDKEALLELAEDLIAKQSAEKAKLTKERDDANADAEQARTQSAERDEKIRALEKKVDTAQRKWRQAKPDDQAETLREQVTLAAQAVLNALAPESDDAGLMGALLALSRHADEHGMDVRAYMGGVIAELADALDRIRAHDYIQAPVMAPAREA